ncbi:hypothetical protein [Robertkochia solimangrovi]|uniref:hypothetical protein n=1 Tax=Robertkochia solimangrovi TaxID=2213046 RepID=UPI00117EBB48|nr:hypothetical protein [Robertkochia solimangrovi]TRZ41969.1 hypothetical protein DMZ48_15130 [Robertkochia solimangrovi]
MNLKNLIRIFLGICLMTLFMQCSKEEEEQPNESEPDYEYSDEFYSGTIEVYPVEIVILQSKTMLASSHYEAKFGDIELELARVNDSVISFMVPSAAPQGSTKLHFLEKGKLVEVDFNVKPNLVVENHDEVMLSMISMSRNSLVLEDGTTASGEWEDALKNLIDEFQEEYFLISEEGRDDVAAFYELNLKPFMYDAINTEQKADESCFEKRGRVFTAKVVTTVTIVAVLAALVATPEPVFSKVAALNAAIGLYIGIIATHAAMDDLFKCDLFRGIDDLLAELSQKGLGQKALTFSNGSEYRLTVIGEFSGMNQGDLASTNAAVKNKAKEVSGFAAKVTAYKAMYEKAKSLFGWSTSSPAAGAKTLPADSGMSTNAVEAESVIVINNLTNEKVVLTDAIAESPYITASFKNKTLEEQDFSFDVTTTYEGTTATKTFEATLKPSEGSIQVLKGIDAEIGQNNSASLEFKVIDEKEEPIADAQLVISTTNSKASFSTSSIKSAANGMVTITLNADPTNIDDIPVTVALKNSQGEVLYSTTFNVQAKNPFIGSWEMVTFENGYTPGEFVPDYSNPDCPNSAVAEWTLTYQNITIQESSFTISDNERIKRYSVNSETCSRSYIDTKDYPATVTLDYSRNKNVFTSTVVDENGQSTEQSRTLNFISENKIQIGAATYIRK